MKYDPCRTALERVVKELEIWCNSWHPHAYHDPTISLRLIASNARAELAEAPAPVVGDAEVAELVEWLRRQAAKWEIIDREAGLNRSLVAQYFTRAADLVERHTPIPVPTPAPPAKGEVTNEELDDIADETPWRGSPRHFGRNVARAAIAIDRRRRAPMLPAEGEVGELVAKLRRLAPQNPLGTADPTITRAADLLERITNHAPVVGDDDLRGVFYDHCDYDDDASWIESEQFIVAVRAVLAKCGTTPTPTPVAVAQRPWEREGWCDAEGRCWLRQSPESMVWRLVKHGESGWDFTRYPRAVVLPADALPLPEVTA